MIEFGFACTRAKLEDQSSLRGFKRMRLTEDALDDTVLARQFPRAASFLSIDFGSLLGPFFFTLAFNLLFPTVVVSLVYEKEVCTYSCTDLASTRMGIFPCPGLFLSLTFVTPLRIIALFDTHSQILPRPCLPRADEAACDDADDGPGDLCLLGH